MELSLLGDKFADIEEKYDLTEGAEGFGEEGEDVDATDADEEAETDDGHDEEAF